MVGQVRSLLNMARSIPTPSPRDPNYQATDKTVKSSAMMFQHAKSPQERVPVSQQLLFDEVADGTRHGTHPAPPTLSLPSPTQTMHERHFFPSSQRQQQQQPKQPTTAHRQQQRQRQRQRPQRQPQQQEQQQPPQFVNSDATRESTITRIMPTTTPTIATRTPAARATTRQLSPRSVWTQMEPRKALEEILLTRSELDRSNKLYSRLVSLVELNHQGKQQQQQRQNQQRPHLGGGTSANNPNHNHHYNDNGATGTTQGVTDSSGYYGEDYYQI